MVISSLDLILGCEEIVGEKCLNPTYRGVNSQKDVAVLEPKVALLEKHLYLSGTVKVYVSKQENYTQIDFDILNYSKFRLDSKGKDGKLRNVSSNIRGWYNRNHPNHHFQVGEVIIEGEKYELNLTERQD